MEGKWKLHSDDDGVLIFFFYIHCKLEIGISLEHWQRLSLSVVYVTFIGKSKEFFLVFFFQKKSLYLSFWKQLLWGEKGGESECVSF